MIERVDLLEEAEGVVPAGSIGDLGAINVVCGRNNSGKSRLLAGIRDRGQAATLHATRTVREEVRSEFRKVVPLNEAEMGHFDDVLASGMAVLARPWNLRDSDSLVAATSQEFARRGMVEPARKVETVRGRSDVLKPSFLRRAPGPRNRVLVAAPRAFETSPEMDSRARETSPGSEFVHHLFALRASEEDSAPSLRFKRLREVFQELSDGVAFDVVEETVTSHRHLKFRGKGAIGWLPAKSCGQGLQDLLQLLYYAVASDEQVVFVEEPETALHPDLLRRLVQALRVENEKQYFFSTHSNVLLSRGVADSIIVTRYESSRVMFGPAQRRVDAMRELGYTSSDGLACDVLVLVEGANDQDAVKELLRKFGLKDDASVAALPLGGDAMRRVEPKPLAEAFPYVRALVDRDPGSDEARRIFMANCKAAGIPVVRTERYAIQDYFPIQAYRDVFGSQVPEGTDRIDPDVSVSKQLPAVRAKKASALFQLARVTPRAEIEESDVGRFLLEVVELANGKAKVLGDSV